MLGEMCLKYVEAFSLQESAELTKIPIRELLKLYEYGFINLYVDADEMRLSGSLQLLCKKDAPLISHYSNEKKLQDESFSFKAKNLFDFIPSHRPRLTLYHNEYDYFHFIDESNDTQFKIKCWGQW